VPEMFDEKFDPETEGGIPEGLGKLFRRQLSSPSIQNKVLKQIQRGHESWTNVVRARAAELFPQHGFFELGKQTNLTPPPVVRRSAAPASGQGRNHSLCVQNQIRHG
jgi:hypothetical protein